MNRLLESLRDKLVENGWTISTADDIHTLHLTTDHGRLANVEEAAFGPTTHDNCIVLDHKVSRKTDFIPAITQVLEEK